MEDGPDEFEEYRARSYSGGFSPSKYRKSRVKTVDSTDARGQRVLDWLEDCCNAKSSNLNSCNSPDLDTTSKQRFHDTGMRQKSEPESGLPLCKKIHNNNHTVSGIRDWIHLVKSSVNKTPPISKQMSYSTPRIDRQPNEKQLLQVYFTKVNGGNTGNRKPNIDSKPHHLLYHKHAYNNYPHHLHHQVLNTPVSPRSNHPWSLDIEDSMRPRMPCRSPGAQVRGTLQSHLTVPCTNLPADRPSSLQFHPLRKVRSFVIVGNKLVKENDALLCDSPPSMNASMIADNYKGTEFCRQTAQSHDHHHRGKAWNNKLRRSGSTGQMSAPVMKKEFNPFVSPPSEVSSSKFTHPHLGMNQVTSSYPESYNVMLIGRKGVGKSAIVSQFLKSENSFSPRDQWMEDCDAEDNIQRNRASILLDGEEATLAIIDKSSTEDCTNLRPSESIDKHPHYLSGSDMVDVSAFVVVYSVEDRASYESAIDSLYELRHSDVKGSHGSHRQACILVANKVDLVRTRSVTEQEGRSAAVMYDCKYIEVSATIDHHIDELFIGILKQIRLIASRRKLSEATSCGEPDAPASRYPGGSEIEGPGTARVKQCEDCGRHRGSDSCCLTAARHNVLRRLLRGERRASRSCANLYVL